MNEQSDKWAVGIDIGGTKISVAQVDVNGNIVARNVFRTRVESGAEAIIKDIVAAVEKLEKETGLPPSAAGIGMAGQITLETGVVQFAPNLGWKEVPLKEILQKELKIPVIVLNDVRAATWGEWHHGAGIGKTELICLFIGTGIGGGIVCNNQLLTGSNNSAGELGHITIELNGPECTCGNRGCLEAFAGGWALAKRARAEIEGETTAGAAILKQALDKVGDVSARHLIEAAREGDSLAQEIINDAIEAITAGCVSFVNAFNPSCLILGGGLGLALPDLINKVTDGVKKSALKTATEKLEIKAAALQTEAGVIGAASFALQSLKK